jgi:hypothetical protein
MISYFFDVPSGELHKQIQCKPASGQSFFFDFVPYVWTAG